MARSHSTPRLPETMAKTGRNPLTNTLEDAVQHREIEKRKNWPTPTAHDGNRRDKLDSWKKRRQRWEEKGVNLHKGLNIAVALEEEEKIKVKKMWPTPTSTDGQRGDVKNLDGYKRRKEKWKKKGVNIQKPLDVAVALDEEKKNVEDTDSN